LYISCVLGATYADIYKNMHLKKKLNLFFVLY